MFYKKVKEAMHKFYIWVNLLIWLKVWVELHQRFVQFCRKIGAGVFFYIMEFSQKTFFTLVIWNVFEIYKFLKCCKIYKEICTTFQSLSMVWLVILNWCITFCYLLKRLLDLGRIPNYLCRVYNWWCFNIGMPIRRHLIGFKLL